MAATITQIAKEAGVSASVVSRLLRNDQTLRIAPETYERVMAVHQRLGSPRSPGQRSSKGRKSCHVVVLFNRRYASHGTHGVTDDAFFQSFEKTLEANDSWLSVVFYDQEKRLETMQKLVRDNDACHALLLRNGLVDDEEAKLLLSQGFPHVCTDHRAERFAINTLTADEQGGFHTAIEHLKSLGHSSVTYFGQRIHRYGAFVAAAIDSGLPLEALGLCDYTLPDEARFDPKVVEQLAHDAWRKWLTQQKTLPTAVCCHNDLGALGVMRACRDAGIVPGRDISIVGFDNIAGLRDTDNAGDFREAATLTTIDNPRSRIGAYAAQWLLAQSQQTMQPIHVKMPMELVIRETTSACKPARPIK